MAHFLLFVYNRTMKYRPKEIQLKNGKKGIIKHANMHDAKEYLDFLMQISKETENTIRYPEEMNVTVEKEALILKSMEQSSSQYMLGVYVNQKLVATGHCYCIGDRIKLRHRSGVGISVLKDYWNLGIGKILMQEMIDIMSNNGYEQLELDVMGNNERAISLYKKLGFVECGRLPHGIRFIDGSYADLVTMVKILNM